jgi:hypothetical protein
MRFTESVLTSSAESSPKSTPVTADDTGCEVFIAAEMRAQLCASCYEKP